MNRKPLKKGRVLMRLLEIKGDDYSVDECVMDPGAGGEELRWEGTQVEYLTRVPRGEIEIGNKSRPLPGSKAFIVKKDQRHKLRNSSPYPWSFQMTFKPPWNPKRAFYRVGKREIRGDEVWFELRTHLGDRISRAKYQLHELGAKMGNVSVQLNPGAKSLESFHKGATVIVTGVKGSGVIRIDGEPQEMKVGDKVIVKPGQPYQLQNTTRRPWLVNQIHRPQWEPDDTFYIYDDRIIPADQVWFEFIVSDDRR